MVKDSAKAIFPDIPDIYTDRVRMTMTVFGANLTFGLSDPHPEPGKEDEVIGILELARIRMSLEHAKMMAMLLTQQLKIYENKTETVIALPKKALEQLNLKDVKW